MFWKILKWITIAPGTIEVITKAVRKKREQKHRHKVEIEKLRKAK